MELPRSRCSRSHLPPPTLHKEWRLRGLALPAPRGGEAGDGRRPRLPWPPPWRPLLTEPQLRRGIAFYGSGARLEAVAAKLLAGRPIKAFTLGGSVTQGTGASNRTATSYPSRFFHFLNASFPHSDHVLANKGIGGTTSSIFALCAEALVPPDSDLIVVEATFNEPSDAPYASPSRRTFEQLLRRLARLPGRPAVLVLHHYAWWFCSGDGVQAGLYYRQAETQFSTLAQYYDMPSLSVRDAVWQLMRADVAPFKVSHVLKAGQVTPAGAALPVAEPGTEGDYFFSDRVHPSDVGHQVMAELLAGAVLRAAENVLNGDASAAADSAAGTGTAASVPDGGKGGGGMGGPRQARQAGSDGGPNRREDEQQQQQAEAASQEGQRQQQAEAQESQQRRRQRRRRRRRLREGPAEELPAGEPGGHGEAAEAGGGEARGELPPPMIPGNADVPSTVCAMQEKFKPLAAGMHGFRYLPERPNGTSFAEQKWGYRGERPGDWLELELSTADASPDAGSTSHLYLGYLRSYRGMGLAQAECVAGCTCAAASMDGLWQQNVSLTQIRELEVTQHPSCRLRITILERPGSQAASGAGQDSDGGGGGDGSSKFQLNSLVMSHLPVTLDNRIASAADGMVEAG